MRLVYFLIGGALIALLVHIITIFWVPTMSGNQAFAVLNRIGAQGGFVILPDPGIPPDPTALVTDEIPYRDPYLTVGTCRFDLDRGPLGIRGTVRSPYWSFSIHRENGEYHYGLTQSAIRDGRIQIDLRNAAQVRARLLDPDAPISDAIEVELPFNVGVILVKSLSTVVSERAAVEEAMDGMVCGPLASS